MFRLPDNEPRPRGHKRRVLVVDDEPTLRLGFTYALVSPDVEVESAASGRQALECLREARYDIVILDLRMPDIDGLGVIEAVRLADSHLPIVLCSAAITASVALRAIRHGVVDFLLKPVRPVDLRGVVHFVLDRENTPLSHALNAARNGDFAEAHATLEQTLPLDTRVSGWLEVFRSLAADGLADGPPVTDVIERLGLDRLAFSVNIT